MIYVKPYPQAQLIMIGKEVQSGVVFGKISLDNKSITELEQFFEDRIQDGQTKFLLDLSLITYIYSNGIGMLIDIYHHLNSIGGALKIINPSLAVNNIFKSLKINSIIETYTDMDQALQSFL